MGIDCMNFGFMYCVCLVATDLHQLAAPDLQQTLTLLLLICDKKVVSLPLI